MDISGFALNMAIGFYAKPRINIGNKVIVATPLILQIQVGILRIGFECV